MRFFLHFFVLLSAVALFQWLLPWWVLVPVAALVAWLLPLRSALAHFAVGFLAIALLWGLSAAWLNAQNEGILAERIGALFQGLSAAGLIWVTAILGGLLGALGSLCGYMIQRLLASKPGIRT